jgi:hypothetical protein
LGQRGNSSSELVETGSYSVCAVTCLLPPHSSPPFKKFSTFTDLSKTPRPIARSSTRRRGCRLVAFSKTSRRATSPIPPTSNFTRISVRAEERTVYSKMEYDDIAAYEVQTALKEEYIRT